MQGIAADAGMPFASQRCLVALLPSQLQLPWRTVSAYALFEHWVRQQPRVGSARRRHCRFAHAAAED